MISQVNFYWDGDLEYFATIGIGSPGLVLAPEVGDEIWVRHYQRQPREAAVMAQSLTMNLIPVVVISRKFEMSTSRLTPRQEWDGDTEFQLAVFVQRINKDQATDK